MHTYTHKHTHTQRWIALVCVIVFVCPRGRCLQCRLHDSALKIPHTQTYIYMNIYTYIYIYIYKQMTPQREAPSMHVSSSSYVVHVSSSSYIYKYI
jgi:hypothetical protein